MTNTLVQLLPALSTFIGAFVLMAWLDPVIALLWMGMAEIESGQLDNKLIFGRFLMIQDVL